MQKLNLLLNKFNASEREMSFVVDSPISDDKELILIDKLVEIPSLIINGSDMKDGFLNRLCQIPQQPNRKSFGTAIKLCSKLKECKNHMAWSKSWHNGDDE
jgi:hypothetical protein